MWNRKKHRIVALEVALEAANSARTFHEDQAQGWRNAHAEANILATKAIADMEYQRSVALYWKSFGLPSEGMARPGLSRQAEEFRSGLSIKAEDKTSPWSLKNPEPSFLDDAAHTTATVKTDPTLHSHPAQAPRVHGHLTVIDGGKS